MNESLSQSCQRKTSLKVVTIFEGFESPPLAREQSAAFTSQYSELRFLFPGCSCWNTGTVQPRSAILHS